MKSFVAFVLTMAAASVSAAPAGLSNRYFELTSGTPITNSWVSADKTWRVQAGYDNGKSVILFSYKDVTLAKDDLKFPASDKVTFYIGDDCKVTTKKPSKGGKCILLFSKRSSESYALLNDKPMGIEMDSYNDKLISKTVSGKGKDPVYLLDSGVFGKGDLIGHGSHSYRMLTELLGGQDRVTMINLLKDYKKPLDQRKIKEETVVKAIGEIATKKAWIVLPLSFEGTETPAFNCAAQLAYQAGSRIIKAAGIKNKCDNPNGYIQLVSTKGVCANDAVAIEDGSSYVKSVEATSFATIRKAATLAGKEVLPYTLPTAAKATDYCAAIGLKGATAATVDWDKLAKKAKSDEGTLAASNLSPPRRVYPGPVLPTF